jgi:hypothetical protein
VVRNLQQQQHQQQLVKSEHSTEEYNRPVLTRLSYSSRA